MIKLVSVFLLLTPGCRSQCTSHSCEETDSMDIRMRIVMQRLEELAQENKILKTNIAEMQSTNEELQTTNRKLQISIDRLQTNITRLEMGSVAPSAAYFSVAADRAENYPTRVTLKFHHTFTNVVPAGTTGGWDPATNMYTCPVTGHYMFVVTIWHGYSHGDFQADLVRGYTRITYMTNRKDSSINGMVLFSSSMQAIVPCAAGENVRVRVFCIGRSTCGLYDDSGHYNTFSGFKL